jgi:uncharacterized protein DUF402
MRSEGDVVVWRSLAFGHIRFAMPHLVVELNSEQVVLWLPGGRRGKIFSGKPLHEIESLDEADWSLLDKVWRGEGVLKVHRFGTHHSLWHLDDGWYVNLEEPWRASRVGWDTRDLALDIVVERDGSWRWKDEDHLAAAVERGWITQDQARLVREEGERVLAARPWPTGWESWRPDPSWPAPELPDGWDVV